MSQTITISANALMLAPPALLLTGGLIVAVALRGFLTTGIEVARLNAANDDKTARWLWLRGYRKTPHAGPDVTSAPILRADHEGEVLHVEHATAELRQLITQLDETDDDAMPVVAASCCTAHGDEPCAQDSGLVPPYCCDDCPDRTPALSDRSHADEQADHTDTDRPRWWATVAAFVVLAPVAYARRQLPVLAEWTRERLKSNEQRAAEFIAQADKEPWVLYDEDDLRDKGATEQELSMLRRGFVPIFEAERVNDLFPENLPEPTPEPEPVRIVRVNRYRDPGMTGQFPYVKVAGAPRHAAPAPEPEMPAINPVPAQRTGGEA